MCSRSGSACGAKRRDDRAIRRENCITLFTEIDSRVKDLSSGSDNSFDIRISYMKLNLRDSQMSLCGGCTGNFAIDIFFCSVIHLAIA